MEAMVSCMAPINSPTGHNWYLQLVTGISMQHGFQLFPAGGRIAHHLAAIFRQFGMVWMFFMEKNMLIKCLGNFWIWKIEHPKRNSCLFIQQPYNYWKMMEGKCYAGFGQCQKHHPVVSVAWLCKKNCFLIFLVKWTVSLMMHSRCIKKTKYIYLFIYTSIYEKMRIDSSSHWWYSFN